MSPPTALSWEHVKSLAELAESEDAARRKVRFVDLGNGELLDLQSPLKTKQATA